MNWDKLSAIISLFSTIGSFVASVVALWIACTEQKRIEKYRKKKILKQDVDLILIPTKEWNNGAKYQELLGELTGQNNINRLAREAKKNSSINDFCKENQGQETVFKQIENERINNIASRLFKGDISMLPISEFYWIECERIYGVNIKDDIFVARARQQLIASQYFKDALITAKGQKHDFALKNKNN